jgi:NAD-dependent dihydropyrimidine dehydrogenase PreA subunit
MPTRFPGPAVARLQLSDGYPREKVKINGAELQYVNSMLTIHRDICGYCGCCVSVCPNGALELIDAYLSADGSCTSCGICAKACPLGALEVVNEGKV